MKGRLQEFALVGEIIGALAVVVTLLFVGLELRQSNRLASTESLRVGTRIWVDEYSDSFGSEESTAFMRQALNDYQSLSDDEKGRFFAAVFGFVAAFDTIQNQYEAGLLREEVYVSIARGYYRLVTMPGAQELFRENSPSLPPYLYHPTEDQALVIQEDDFGTFSFLQRN